MKNGYLTDYPVCPEIPLHLSTQWGLSEVRCFIVVAGRKERVGLIYRLQEQVAASRFDLKSAPISLGNRSNTSEI